MKKSFLMAASLALCTSLAGCEDQQQEIQPIANIIATADSGNPRPFFDGTDCRGKGGDCLPPTPPPQQRATMTSFDNIMSTPSSVSKYFNGSDWQSFFPELTKEENSDVLNAVRSGGYKFIKYYSPESGKSFYIIGRHNVSVKNHSFVIPISE